MATAWGSISLEASTIAGRIASSELSDRPNIAIFYTGDFSGVRSTTKIDFALGGFQADELGCV